MNFFLSILRFFVPPPVTIRPGRRLATGWLLLVLAGVPGLGATELAPFLDANGAFWEQSPDSFMVEQPQPRVFHWLAEDRHTEANYLADRSREKLTFLAMPVSEAMIRFAKERPARIELSLFSRGDDGAMNIKGFEQAVEHICGTVSQWTGNPGVAGSRQRVVGDMVVMQRGWAFGKYRAELTWNAPSGNTRKFRAEYINLAIEPNDDGAAARKPNGAQLAATTGKMDLKNNVKTDPSGDVHIEGLPMVDQGNKGYCAAATAERILRYYGAEVNMHMIAQLADTTSGGGTDMDFMVQMLRKASTKLGVSTKALKELDTQGLLRELDRYNSMARRAKVRPLTSPTSGAINLTELLSNLDPAVWKQFKTEKEKSDYVRFQDDIIRYIQIGIPLAWTVQLGLYPEEKISSQASGGHMRIILGYNSKTKEILYTDSWGRGHEFKRMPADNAWAITIALHALEPKRL